MKLTSHKLIILVGAWLLLSPSGSGGLVRADTKARNCADKEPEVTIAKALTAIIGLAPSAEPRELFTHALQLRGAAVPGGEKPKYWQELKAKPELRETAIYGADSPQSQAVLKVIMPVLNLYGRKWDVAVIGQGAPFVGTFRQCIFIVSTGLLQFVTDEELCSFAAHELAHECFIEELREADRLHCASAYYLAELKSDLVAALCCLLLKSNPLAIVSGVARVETYYLRVEPSVLRVETHPDSVHRRRCIELFLAKIKGPLFEHPKALRR